MLFTDLPVESMSQAGHDDHILNWLEKNGMELTRENYLAIAYPDGDVPTDLDEADLPEQIRNT
jgi:hypothetical protein